MTIIANTRPMGQVGVMTKPLRDLTTLELFNLYGRTIWALAQCDEGEPNYAATAAQRTSLEAEAARRFRQEQTANARLLDAVLVSDPALNEYVAGIL